MSNEQGENQPIEENTNSNTEVLNSNSNAFLNGDGSRGNLTTSALETTNTNQGGQQVKAAAATNDGSFKPVVIDPRGEFTGDQVAIGNTLAYLLDISNPVMEQQKNTRTVKGADGKERTITETRNVIKYYEYNAIEGKQFDKYIAEKFGGKYKLDSVNNQIIKVQPDQPKA